MPETRKMWTRGDVEAGIGDGYICDIKRNGRWDDSIYGKSVASVRRRANARVALLNAGEAHPALVEAAQAVCEATAAFNDQFYVPPNDPLYKVYEALLVADDALRDLLAKDDDATK